jgi:acyl carrier protein
MELNDFINVLAEQFEDTDISELTPDCDFQELEEWSSLTGMAIIAMAKTQYGKTVTGKEIRGCNTIEDLFNLIKSK